MSDPTPPEFPPVDPTTFDLIIVGTSLPSSILAAASSSLSPSTTILHLDPNPFYGSHFSSLPPPDLSSFLNISPPINISPLLDPTQQNIAPSPVDPTVIPLTTRPLYTSVSTTPLPASLDTSRVHLDVSGPRVLFCADKMIELLLKTGLNNYMDFVTVDRSFVYDSESKGLVTVPDSPQAVFNDKRLRARVKDKFRLTKFFKVVKEHLSGESLVEGEDLERPFFEYLGKLGLPEDFRRNILYAIALADYDQENVEVCKDLLKTKDGIDRLALYHSSMARFPTVSGAMLYPMYGQGELPQAFCRRAAVKGSIYVGV